MKQLNRRNRPEPPVSPPVNTRWTRHLAARLNAGVSGDFVDATLTIPIPPPPSSPRKPFVTLLLSLHEAVDPHAGLQRAYRGGALDFAGAQLAAAVKHRARARHRGRLLHRWHLRHSSTPGHALPADPTLP